MPRKGAILVRAGQELHESLLKEAVRRRLSLNRLCRELLESHRPAGKGRSEVGPWFDAGAERIGTRIRELFGPSLEAVVLFGSTARGDEREDSDIDLLLVVRADVALERDLYRRWDEAFAAPSERKYAPHFAHLPSGTGNAGSLWFEVALEGIVWWDRSGEVSRFLRRLRSEMAGNRIERKWAHGHPYWVRNG